MSSQEIIEQSLFEVNPARFAKIEKEAFDFGKLYYGDGAIKDDIFEVVNNYMRQKDKILELIRFPIKDDEFCGLTFVKKDKVFLFINSNLPLEKQIFACGHEMYHIYCYVNDLNYEIYQKGSLLFSSDMTDDIMNSKEDREANAFAATLLVSEKQLHEKMKIFGISPNNISLEDTVKLMSIFAVPYKTIILRLYECKCVSRKKALCLLDISDRNEIDGVLKIINESGIGKKWQQRTPMEVQFGSLMTLLNENQKNEFIEEKRIFEDREVLEEIKNKLGEPF